MKVFCLYIYSVAETHLFSTKKLAKNFAKTLAGEEENCSPDDFEITELTIDPKTIETPFGRKAKLSENYSLPAFQFEDEEE